MSAAPAPTRMKCHCGTGMMPTLGQGEGYVCPNCDVCQPQEILFERRKTAQDVRFDMYWLRVMNKEYPPMPDGWERKLPGTDIVPPTQGDASPPENEGETNGND